MQRILIIEDSQQDYRDLVDELDKYNVEYYPKREDFEEFSRLLVQYAMRRTDSQLEDIRNRIKSVAPDFVVLDKSLKFSDESDRTGLLIKEKILEPDFPSSIIFFYTVSQPTDDYKYYITKNPDIGLDAELRIQLIEPFGISLREMVDEVKVGDQAESWEAKINIGSLAYDELKKSISPPLTYVKYSKLYNFKIYPWVQFFLDTLFMVAFVIALVVSVIGGISIFLYEILKHPDIFHIAEYAFICFLPALIIFGFFVFYVHSLKPYFNKKSTIDLNYEEASRLIMLTKKLFVSSLISYLFTKLIEKILVDKPIGFENSVEGGGAEKYINYFTVSYPELQPIFQLYLIGGCIILLVLYYIYLNSHKTHSK